ncbi:hypothetical protein NSERKGN1266_47570 [Nocardia seriolae]|nr:hypothetical protein NSERKGN1266_47570 [Nocardia seriolae]BEK96102.1 hypothetical protein NSER024013_40080 [Nocardia seriolae]
MNMGEFESLGVSTDYLAGNGLAAFIIRTIGPWRHRPRAIYSGTGAPPGG